MPELRSRSPRSGGSPGVRIDLGLPQTDAYHRLFAGLDQQQGTLVAWLSLTSWRSCLAPGFCGFLEEATLHTKVSHSRIHQAVSSYIKLSAPTESLFHCKPIVQLISHSRESTSPGMIHYLAIH